MTHSHETPSNFPPVAEAETPEQKISQITSEIDSVIGTEPIIRPKNFGPYNSELGLDPDEYDVFQAPTPNANQNQIYGLTRKYEAYKYVSKADDSIIHEVRSTTPPIGEKLDGVNGSTITYRLHGDGKIERMISEDEVTEPSQLVFIEARTDEQRDTWLDDMQKQLEERRKYIDDTEFTEQFYEEKQGEQFAKDIAEREPVKSGKVKRFGQGILKSIKVKKP